MKQNEREKKKISINNRMVLYYVYTFFVLSVPFIAKYLLRYNLSSFCLHLYNGCFYISLFIILAFEDKIMKKMMEKTDFELYNKLMNDKNDGFISIFTKLDGSDWKKSNTQIQNYFKESFPQYWEYALKLRRYFFISIILSIISRGLV